MEAESPSPCQRNWMLHAIKHPHNASLWNSTKMIPPFLPFDGPNLYNDYIFMDPEYNEQLCFLNQVDSNTDLLDNMILQQDVMQLTKKPRSKGTKVQMSLQTSWQTSWMLWYPLNSPLTGQQFSYITT